MKQRLLLCLLLIGVMLYYAVPRLTLTGSGLESIFAASWLLFALFAVAGNLTGMLYAPKKRKRAETGQMRQRMRAY
ncbi:hypothetical protein [Bacillus sp. CECT 9360]|uniref:hypothetical protein n=1 Tax=Bacillus sp. CECT 9360 TaxID=2845821 RepID=UPI001E598E5D|nr:hypothetical protein [Bacillus sp. CECT 9360]CAH0346218.1 hypothetical protein BCI9360_02540 [Bacillus sp. CECT 9360]